MNNIFFQTEGVFEKESLFMAKFLKRACAIIEKLMMIQKLSSLKIGLKW